MQRKNSTNNVLSTKNCCNKVRPLITALTDQGLADAYMINSISLNCQLIVCKLMLKQTAKRHDFTSELEAAGFPDMRQPLLQLTLIGLIAHLVAERRMFYSVRKIHKSTFGVPQLSRD